MKMKYIITILFVSVFLAMYSCSDMNDLHQEYLDQGEQIYLGSVDSVIVYPGSERIQMKCIVKADPKISELKVFWNSGEDELVIPYTRKNASVDTIPVNIESIMEGTYVFNFVTQDENGNHSINKEITTQIYGTTYSDRLINKSIDEFDAKQVLTITWKPNSEATGVKVVYFDSEGNQQTTITPEGEQTVIEDWKTGSELSYQTTFKPHPNSLDLFYAPVETMILPEFFLLDKGKFSTVSLPYDVSGTAWGGSIDKLWNDVVSGGDFIHTGVDGDPNPQHFTVDLGVLNNLGRLTIHTRSAYQDGYPRIFEVWGTDNIEGAETELPSDDPGWEADMLAKGWTKLKYVERAPYTSPADIDPPYDVDFETDLPPVRYIRFFMIENFTGDPTQNWYHMSEWNVYSRKVHD